MRQLAMALLSLLLFASGAQAQSPKQKSELSEQCRKRANEVFKKKRDGPVSVPTDTSWTFTTYHSHYNSRSNRCFYLLQREGRRENYRDSRGLYKVITLLDLHENKGIGSYEGMTTEPTREEKTFDCLVEQQRCKSEKEWRTLIKPFMED
jgi:hypothetical protein